MAQYTATVEQESYPLGFIKWIEAKRLDKINREIVKTGKTWQGLELPKKIKQGHYYSAYFDGWRIIIHKES